MSFLRKAWTVISIVGVAAAIYLWFQRPKAGGDDAPIVMAGGSMHILTMGAGYTFEPTGQSLTHYSGANATSNRFLARADIVYYDGSRQKAAAPFPDPTGTIDIGYCDTACQPGDAPSPHMDTVTFSVASAGQPLTVSSNLNGQVKDMTMDERFFEFYWKHRPHDWKVYWVRVNGANPIYKCGPSGGDCSLRIHYCKVGCQLPQFP